MCVGVYSSKYVIVRNTSITISGGGGRDSGRDGSRGKLLHTERNNTLYV